MKHSFDGGFLILKFKLSVSGKQSLQNSNCRVLLYVLFFLWACSFANLDAKSVLLKNGRKIDDVEVRVVSKGFEIVHKNGKVERVSLTEVRKIFISNRVPDPIKKPKTVQSIEIPHLDTKTTESLPAIRGKKSNAAVFAEGLIPGWSRLLRNDSYSLKCLGVIFILTELYLAQKSYVYLSPVESALKSSKTPLSPEELIGFASRDTNLINLALVKSIYSNSSKVFLSDGQLMSKERYLYEKQAYVSAFIFVLILDAFLGYTFESWDVVPNLNVSFREKEVSGGVTFRF
ncbi:DNA-binding protein [Leptospira santarosai]|uniref:LA_0442/LA_0875 N-terminal domain-containing protein n=1 Tax=Leptospira santarosai TaxID=28183 RepID=UPI0026E25B7B|nr:DNA-binding protein [Leptospira santarosai]MDO6393557.1 DNA-binding protein [Leptospira santarosai]